MEEIAKKKQSSLLGKILIGFLILSTIAAMYMTVKLVIVGFTFR